MASMRGRSYAMWMKRCRKQWALWCAAPVVAAFLLGCAHNGNSNTGADSKSGGPVALKVTMDHRMETSTDGPGQKTILVLTLAEDRADLLIPNSARERPTIALDGPVSVDVALQDGRGISYTPLDFGLSWEKGDSREVELTDVSLTDVTRLELNGRLKSGLAQHSRAFKVVLIGN